MRASAWQGLQGCSGSRRGDRSGDRDTGRCGPGRGACSCAIATELPARREAELHEAARLLGIGHVTVLDYIDKHLAEAPVDKIRRELVSAIRRHRPQIVVDFRS